MRNRGILLAGGVGYNALLSLIPFFALTVIGLSYIVPRRDILDTIVIQLRGLLPRYTTAIVHTVDAYLGSRQVIGLVSVVFLLFFSSIALRMLEEAIDLIFGSPNSAHKRRLWVSLLLPYAFIAVLITALLVVTLVRLVLGFIGEQSVHVLGHDLSLALPAQLGLQALGFAGQVTLFAAIYKVMPVVQIRLRRAILGGLVAATLWAVISRMLVYYFATISMVNVIYGSLATVIVLLLIMEAASIILLFGAQVIAELERSAEAGLKWYEEPPS